MTAIGLQQVLKDIIGFLCWLSRSFQVTTFLNGGFSFCSRLRVIESCKVNHEQAGVSKKVKAEPFENGSALEPVPMQIVHSERKS